MQHRRRTIQRRRRSRQPHVHIRVGIFLFSTGSHNHTKILEVPLEYLRQVLQSRLLVNQYL